jgi:hypothetical protein
VITQNSSAQPACPKQSTEPRINPNREKKSALVLVNMMSFKKEHRYLSTTEKTPSGRQWESGW